MSESTVLVLAFSRDRALQLDAMLRSFFRHAADPEMAEVVVLYKASSSRHQSQYDELAQEHPEKVRFLRQTAFRPQVLGLLRESSRTGHVRLPAAVLGLGRRVGERKGKRQATPRSQVLFLVDDTLFVRAFPLGAARQALDLCPDALGFSFRLGRNARNCYVLAREQTLPSFELLAPGVLKFRWTTADGDFAYPLEVSSSLYRTAGMARLLQNLRFRDPNTLESQMSLKAAGFSEDAPYLLCWESSPAFSIPVNRVQAVYTNRAGARDEYSLESMAEAFEGGRRIDVAVLDGFVPSACHQEIELSYEERRSRDAGR